MLRDPHGRHIHKLRLSLLDACNFRCVYCMPKNPKFLPAHELMDAGEIYRLARILTDLGIDEIRLTGGEPTLRPDFLDILRRLSHLNLKKLSLTTNGLGLKKLLPSIVKTRCLHLNVSLDALDEKIFFRMTGRKCLEKVLDSLLLAQESGLQTKINAVIMRGINDGQIQRFVDFSATHGIEVRFLELLRIGPIRHQFEMYFVSAGEIIETLKTLGHLTPVVLPPDSTSFNYRLDNGAHIGLIASESRPFCGGCSRLRLSARGDIHPCLMMDRGINLRNKSREEIRAILGTTMALKPTHRIYDVERPMYQIGG